MNDQVLPYVLIVDDDAMFCTTLARSLERLGFNTRFAANTEGALGFARGLRFDRAVVDLRIGAESGLTLIRTLLDTNPDMRIVILTGFASIATAVEAIKLGAAHYLTKPATAREIIAAFDRAAGSAEAETVPDPMTMRRLEWEHLQKVLADHEGNVSAAARALRMHRRTLQRKLRKNPAKS